MNYRERFTLKSVDRLKKNRESAKRSRDAKKYELDVMKNLIKNQEEKIKYYEQFFENDKIINSTKCQEEKYNYYEQFFESDEIIDIIYKKNEQIRNLEEKIKNLSYELHFLRDENNLFYTIINEPLKPII